MFLSTFDSPKIQKSAPGEPPWKPFLLGPCPDCRADNSVQDSLNESSGDPNPTLVFSKILSGFCQFWPSPKSTPSGHLDLLVGGKENSNWTDLYVILIQTGPIVIFLSSDRYTRRHVLRAGTNGRAPNLFHLGCWLKGGVGGSKIQPRTWSLLKPMRGGSIRGLNLSFSPDSWKVIVKSVR